MPTKTPVKKLKKPLVKPKVCLGSIVEHIMTIDLFYLF